MTDRSANAAKQMCVSSSHDAPSGRNRHLNLVGHPLAGRYTFGRSLGDCAEQGRKLRPQSGQLAVIKWIERAGVIGTEQHRVG